MLSSIFVSMYKYFQSQKRLLFISLAIIVVPLIYFAINIKFDTDITKMIPVNKETQHFKKSLENLSSFDKIILLVHSDSSEKTEQIHAIQDSLTQLLIQEKKYVNSIDYQIDETMITRTQEVILNHLPLYIEEQDYQKLDTIIRYNQADSLIEHAYNQLVSPISMVVKTWLLKDPLMLGGHALQNLQKLQSDTSITIHEGYLMKSDLKTGIILIKTKINSSKTEENIKFIEKINNIIQTFEKNNKGITISYFGAPAVAALNAKQIREDIQLTVSVSILLIVCLLFLFYRNIQTAGLIFLPLTFGFIFSLGLLSLFQGSISLIALASGAVVIGIAMDYSFHVLGHFLHVKSKEELLADVSGPLLTGSISTIGAFLSLLFTHSDLLIDFGKFSALMLTGAALFSLIFLPHFLPKNPPKTHAWTDKLSSFFQFEKSSNKYIIFIALGITIFASFYASYVNFEPDLMKINFIPKEVKEAEQLVENHNHKQKVVFFVSKGKTIEEVIKGQENIRENIEKQVKPDEIIKFSGIQNIILSQENREKKIKRWAEFWQTHDKQQFINQIQNKCQQLGMKKESFQAFFDRINLPQNNLSADELNFLTKIVLKDFFSFENDHVELLQMTTLKKNTIIKDFPVNDNQYIIDRQAFYNTFTSLVGEEFNQILLSCSLLVFVILWLSYGRLELTLIAFIPMIISWIWILALMYFLNIQFNIVNIILSTFIFGLGDDYSIFFVEGLQNRYSLGKNNLSSYKVSIMLSAITTVTALGIMILAKHPALKSIALISVIGMTCVVAVSYIFIPFLFNNLITKRIEKGLQPLTISSIFRTIWIYLYFGLGCLLLSIIGIIFFKIFRLQNNTFFFNLYHKLIQMCVKTLLYSVFTTKKNIINPYQETFEKPAIIIANHQSFLDILIILMLHPKIVLVTNEWVWKSPFFGWIVRLAGFISTEEGLEQGEEKVKDLIARGYSIAVFPEGTRSADLEVKRFHKGAFFLAEKFNLDIIPIVIEGAGKGIRKSDMVLNTSDLYISIKKRISAQDTSFGNTYTEKTKNICAKFRKDYNQLRLELPNFVHYSTILSAYIYKGPVLEWYFRIKVKLEKYYQFFENEIPKQAKILNLGCGYGFLDYFLMIQSKEREILAYDYDEEKIQVANHTYLKTNNLQFIQADVTQISYDKQDVILILDVLHYLSQENQEKLVVQAFEQLNVGGKLIIRDGDLDDKQKHKNTALTEFFSIKLLGFNKAEEKISFVSFTQLSGLLKDKNCSTRIISDSKVTSNKMIIFEKYA